MWRSWGHNGSGKSTLAKHMNAILLPTGGKVYVDGIDTSNEDRLLDIRRTVGMVFQNPDNQIVANVVEEDVAFAPGESWGPSGGDPAAGGRRSEGRWACMSSGSMPPICSPAARSSGVGHRRGHRHGAPVHFVLDEPPPCWIPSAGPM